MLESLAQEVGDLRQALIDTQMTLMAVQMSIRDLAIKTDLPSNILVQHTEGIVASIQIQAFLRGVYIASQTPVQKPAFGGAKVFTH